MDIKKLKVNLQSYGVTLDKGISGGRASGAGPAGSVIFLIGCTQINAPFSANTGIESPYKIIRDNGGFALFDGATHIAGIKFPSTPNFYSGNTADNISYRKIALLHGEDCLATTIVQKCDLWGNGKKCRFCAIELSLKGGNTVLRKTPDELAEVAEMAEKSDSVKHITLTSGTSEDFEELSSYLADCVMAIRKKSSLPVHLQVYPLRDYAEPLKRLKEAGVDTLGIHIESFDEDIRNRYTPGKCILTINKIETMLEYAVSIFGKNQVTSFIITGLGETPESVTAGSRRIAALGVYPFIVPHHPIPGTETYSLGTPDPGYQEKIYREVAETLKENDLSSSKVKAGCVRCSACSAIKEFEVN